ncbi:MAG: NTP transferase domain-containing protein [Planctomycetaceae bacterium]|jgi:bifunctional UDP-N-acetylglucosamine pyrophosphorylase/glucosamine-1-phosphate N-acetyltransferase
MSSPLAIILAAGKSTRMKSALPKVLHRVSGRPMIDYVLDAARVAGVQRLVAVVGHQAHAVQAALAGQRDVEFVHQTEQRGTGHAVLMAAEVLRQHTGPVLVLTGDAPLMRAESFVALLNEFRQQSARCVIGTAETEHNFGLGRIVRDSRGEFVKIVEQRDATPEEQAIREINVGCYVFDSASLLAALQQLQPNNAQGELYLTDCCALILKTGGRVVAACKLDVIEALGVNTRAELARVHRALQERCHNHLLVNGVTLVDPAQVAIDLRAQIGADTIIEPFTTIDGPAQIGNNCHIGPHVHLGPQARIPDGTRVPPFTNLG